MSLLSGQMHAADTASDRKAVMISDGIETRIATDIAAIAEEWRAFEKTAIGHVFQAFDFLAPWLATVGSERGISPRIVLGYDRGGELVFLLPFGICTRMATRIVEWLGAEHADFHNGLYAPHFMKMLADNPDSAAALPRDIAGLFKHEADMIELRRQPGTIGDAPNPFAAYAPIPKADSCHLTRLGSSWDAYYRGKRNSSSRRNDRSKRLRLESAGGVRFLDATSPADIERVMASLFAQKKRGLAERGVSDLFAKKTIRDFYMHLAMRPYPEGLTHVAALECAGELIATSWSLVRRNRYYYTMHAFAPGPLARYSPGRHLMYHLMQWAIEHELDIFDFTIGDLDFKSQWCEQTAPLLDSVAALGVRGMGLSAALRLGKTVKRQIKENPVLYSTAKAVRRRAASILE